MALEARIGLKRRLQSKLARHPLHDRVAVAAHEAAFIMRTAVPVYPSSFIVAGETDRVVLFRSTR